MSEWLETTLRGLFVIACYRLALWAFGYRVVAGRPLWHRLRSACSECGEPIGKSGWASVNNGPRVHLGDCFLAQLRTER